MNRESTTIRKTSNWSKILNENWRSECFNERVAFYLNEIQFNVRICAQQLLPNDHELLFTETLLFSRTGSNTIQDPHADLEPTYSGTAILAVVALEPGTTLFVCPGTHCIEKIRQNTVFASAYSL